MWLLWNRSCCCLTTCCTFFPWETGGADHRYDLQLMGVRSLVHGTPNQLVESSNGFGTNIVNQKVAFCGHRYFCAFGAVISGFLCSAVSGLIEAAPGTCYVGTVNLPRSICLVPNQSSVSMRRGAFCAVFGRAVAYFSVGWGFLSLFCVRCTEFIIGAGEQSHIVPLDSYDVSSEFGLGPGIRNCNVYNIFVNVMFQFVLCILRKELKNILIWLCLTCK